MTGTNGKSSSYGQYCPLALAAELLCRRWTILIISRVIDGCTTFSDIHRGVPRISPSLLSTRLSELEHAGIVRRRRMSNETRYLYEPTQAALDLADLIDRMAIWGQQWSRDMNMDDLDPAFLAWSMSLRMNTEAMPPGRTVIGFEFSGTPTEFARFWLVNNDGKVDMCLKNPGYDTDLLVRSDLRCFVEAWRGFRDLKREIQNGNIVVSGAPKLTRDFPGWLLLSALAPYQRRMRGREKELYSTA